MELVRIFAPKCLPLLASISYRSHSDTSSVAFVVASRNDITLLLIPWPVTGKNTYGENINTLRNFQSLIWKENFSQEDHRTKSWQKKVGLKYICRGSVCTTSFEGEERDSNRTREVEFKYINLQISYTIVISYASFARIKFCFLKRCIWKEAIFSVDLDNNDRERYAIYMCNCFIIQLMGWCWRKIEENSYCKLSVVDRPRPI